MRLFYIILCLPLFLSNCETSNKDLPDSFLSENQKHAAEVVTFGSINNTNDAIILSAITDVTTIDSEFIYLAEVGTQKIHAFTYDGEHLWSTGGEGPGPGEFEFISAMSTQDEKLYVFDRLKQTITVYTYEGERLFEVSVDTGGSTVFNMHVNQHGKTVLPNPDPEAQTLVDIYSTDFDQKLHQVVSYDDVLHTEHPELEQEVINQNAGSAFLVGESTLAYAPYLYQGKLFIYQIKEDSWEHTGTIDGYRDIENTVTFYETSEGESERSDLSGFHPEQGGYFHSVIHTMSHGLYPQKNGLLAHISSLLHENERRYFVVELFDISEGSLTDFYVIDNLSARPQLTKMPVGMDPDGRIYITDADGEIPLRAVAVNE